MNYELFQVIFEILSDTLVQMNAGVASHVVLLTRIGKEVGLCAGLDASIEERQTMLWYDGIVVIARDDLELTLQIACLVDETGLFVTFRIRLRRVHIALAIHHLVPFPVNNGTAGYANLEYVRIVGHQRDGHETTEGPSVNT